MILSNGVCSPPRFGVTFDVFGNNGKTALNFTSADFQTGYIRPSLSAITRFG